jgi:uncharacterized membrane protein required for colicin V production
MDDASVLDALFGVIAVLLLPIGYRRGAIREVFSTAGIFTGAALAASWGRPWGSDLADLMDIRIGTGQLVVAAGFVVGAMLVLGYGGAYAAVRNVPRLWGRLAGAVLAVINGALVAAYILDYIDTLLDDDDARRTLADSEVATVLLDEFGWVLVGGAGIALAMILLATLFGRERNELRVAAAAPSAPGQRPWAQEQRRGPRLRWGRDDDKVEPVERGYDPATGRYTADAAHYAETMPIATAPRGSYPGSDGGPVTGNEWIGFGQSQAGFTPAASAGESQGEAIRCPSCGERLASGDAFCPRCGRART